MAEDEEKFRSMGLFLYGAPEGLFQRIETLASEGGPLKQELLAFKANLESATMVGNVPYQLTLSSVLDELYYRIHSAERIRALKIADTDQVREEVATRIASQRFEEQLHDPEALTTRAKHVLRLLDRHLEREEFECSAQELLRQVLVMLWAAFEVLANDSLRQLLNQKPKLVVALAQSKSYRDYLSERRLLEALGESSFDLSRKMGDYFCEFVRLDSLEKIREVAQHCLASTDLEKNLKDPRLWRLSQQRHLIVHRRGRIDSAYISKTGDTASVGERLMVDADYVESCLLLVGDIGCALYGAANMVATSKD